MRTIDRSSTFKHDYKRDSKERRRATLDNMLKSVLLTLATERCLNFHYYDHDLSGDCSDYRECHARPDPLLIYCRSDSATFRVARLGLVGMSG